MTTEIHINYTITNDQSAGQQTSLTTDTGDDVLISFTSDVFSSSSLSSDLITFLNGTLLTAFPALDGEFADTVEAAKSDESNPIVTVTQNSGTVANLYFSDSAGALLDGDQAMWDDDGLSGTPDVPLTTVDGANIYLWSYGDDFVVATTSNVAGAGNVVAVFHLVDDDPNHLSADIEMVTFIPIAHPDSTDPDDTVNWGDVLNVSASASLSFDFDNLASGNFLHVTVGTEAAGLLVSGLNPVVQSDGAINKQASDTINTSQGGQGATIGVDNQMFVPGETAVFSFVKGQTPGTYTNINDVNYDDFLDVKDGAIFISQVQGNKSTNFTMKIDVFSAGGTNTDPEDGFSYLDNNLGSGSNLGTDSGQSALKDDTPVTVQSVVVKVGNMIVAERSLGDTGTTTFDGRTDIDITFNDNNTFTVDGLKASDTIQWFTDDPTTPAFETFNRFYVTSMEGKFDVGRVETSQGITVTQPVGSDLLVDDDGPTAAITDTGVTVVHDESAGLQTSAFADNPIVLIDDTSDVQATDSLSTYGTFSAGDTLTIDGVVVFTYGSGNDGTTVGALLSRVVGSSIDSNGDLVLNRPFGSNATIELGGAVATGLGVDGIVYNTDLNSDSVEDNNDDDQAGTLPTELPAALGALDLTAIGWAQSASAVVTAENTDFGSDGPAATDSLVWSLEVGNSNANADSGLLWRDPATGDDHKILLNVETVTVGTEDVDIVVGRVDANDDGDVDGTGEDIALAVTIGQDGFLSVAQFLPIAHIPDTGPDQAAAMLDTALVAVLTAYDGDQDFDVAREDIGNHVIIEDDGPAAGSVALETLQEDDLVGNDTTDPQTLSTGNNDDASTDLFTGTINLTQEAILSTGVDTPVTFHLKTVAELQTGDGLPDLYSKGEQLTYVTDYDNGTITARAGSETGRVVFVFELFQDSGTGDFKAKLTLYDQLDHEVDSNKYTEGFGLDTDGDPSTTSDAKGFIDFTSLLAGQDLDTDPINMPDVQFAVKDDVPLFTADILSADFSDSAHPGVEFVDGDSVSHSLNGSIGTDENDSNDQAWDGTKTYTFTDFNIVQTTIDGLQGAIVDDGTRVVFYTDGDGGTANQYDDGIDTLWFDNVLNPIDSVTDSSNSTGAGQYTFTVQHDAPNQFQLFGFNDLPAGQNLFGMVGNAQDAIVVFGSDPDLNADGTMTPTSQTVNSSKGSSYADTVIGNSNNHFDHAGEDLWTLFVTDPDTRYLAGAVGGLDQNEADDADNVQYGSLKEVDSAFYQTSRVVSSTSSQTISAFNVGDNTTEGRAIVDGLDTNGATNYSPSIATRVSIDEVRIYNPIDLRPAGTTLGDDGVIFQQETRGGPDTSSLITFNSDGTVTVSGVAEGMVVEFLTNDTGGFDAFDIDYVSGKYDIGFIGNSVGQDTPDQKFDFTVALTDFDGDQVTSNTFDVAVDGTGQYNDDQFHTLA